MSNQTADYTDFRRSFERVAPELIAQAAQYPSSVWADVLGRRGGMHGRIAPLLGTMRFAGSAFTVEVRPGDNLMVHAALALAQPGDVLVIDGKGDLSCALMGEIMCSQAAAAGVAAIVIDGAVRDADALRQAVLPVFAAGLNPNGPTKNIPGRLNHPVSVGGITVCAGDLVVGDADGVTVIERERVVACLPLAEAKLRAEQARLSAIAAKQALVPAWLEDALRRAGVLTHGTCL